MSTNENTANITIGFDERPAVEGMNNVTKSIDKNTEKSNKRIASLEKQLQALTKTITNAGKSNALGEMAAKSGAAMDKANAQAQKLRLEIEKLKASAEKPLAVALTEEQRTKTAAQRGQNELNRIGARTYQGITEGNQRIQRDRLNAEDRRAAAEKRKQDRIDFFDHQQRELGKTRIEREQSVERRRIAREAGQAQRREVREVDAVIKRSLLAPTAMQAQVAAAIQGPKASFARQGMMNLGLTTSQANMNLLQARGISQQNAAFLAGGGGARPPGLGGRPPGGGGGLFGGLMRGGAGQFARSAAAGLGIGAGGYAIAQAGRSVVEATQTATAYDRQRIAAENLAGSQEKLNELLDAYAKASGGAVDEATELSNVTRLMATGFADSVEDTERFVRATRGASIALGKPQDYVIQETQLAISNVSQKRLDQIGLGISEVTNKIAELRKENAGWSRDTAFHEAVISLMDEKYGALTRTVEGQATALELLGKTWKDFMLQLGSDAQGPVSKMANALRRLLERIKEAKEQVDKGISTGEQPTRNVGWDERLAIESQRSVIGRPLALPEETGPFGGGTRGGMTIEGQAAGHEVSMRNFGDALDRLSIRLLAFTLNVPVTADMLEKSYPAPPVGATGPLTGPRPSIIRPIPVDPLIAQRAEVKNEARLAIEQVEKQANEARLSEIKSFETQRASIIESYGRQMVRSEEDFARQRARSQRDFDKSIEKIGTDAVKREEKQAKELAKQEEKWQRDLDKNIAKAREDHAESVAEIQEKYNKDREKAEERHKDNMIKAAGQLDAIAVLEERKRWKDENKEREEGHKEALEKNKKALDKSIEEAMEAHQERLDDAREAHAEQIQEGKDADKERIQDMRDARKQQLADEDEDRAIQKARAIEDHNAQLDELDRQHGLRMEQLEKQAEDETRIIEDALMADLHALGLYIEGYQEMLDEQAKKTEEWFDDFIEMLEKRLKLEQEFNRREEQRLWHFDPELATEPKMVEYANGGPVSKTGPAMLHAGEFVLSRDMIANASSTFSSTSSSKSIVFENGAIQIQTTPGYETLVGDLVEDRVVRLLENY